MGFLKIWSHWLKTRLLVYDHGAALVAFAHERKEHCGLLGALLDVAEIVEYEHLKEIEFAKRSRQGEVTLGGEQILDKGIGRREEDGAPCFRPRRVSPASWLWPLPCWEFHPPGCTVFSGHTMFSDEARLVALKTLPLQQTLSHS